MNDDRKVIRNSVVVRIFEDGSWKYGDQRYDPAETRHHCNLELINVTDADIDEIAANFNWEQDSTLSRAIRKIPFSIISQELYEYVMSPLQHTCTPAPIMA